MNDPDPTRSPLMIGIGGRTADLIRKTDIGDGTDLIIIDTDIRTRSRFPDLNVVIVGQNIVKGEGSGGNMNLARACFKMDMETIAPQILGRPIVMVAASTEGATGIAGSVEISSLLTKLGLPSFSFLLHEGREQNGGMDPLKVASLLLDGPLRPGCILLSEEGEDGTEKDPFGLSASLPSIFRGTMGSSHYPISPSAWSILRDDGGPFEIGTLDLGVEGARTNIGSPAIISLTIPEIMSTEEVRRIVETSFGHIESIHMGMTMDKDADHVHGAHISKARNKLPSGEGPPPDPQLIKDLIDGSFDHEIGPDLISFDKNDL